MHWPHLGPVDGLRGVDGQRLHVASLASTLMSTDEAHRAELSEHLSARLKVGTAGAQAA